MKISDESADGFENVARYNHKLGGEMKLIQFFLSAILNQSDQALFKRKISGQTLILTLLQGYLLNVK